MLNGCSNNSSKRIKEKGMLKDLDESEEINACSIQAEILVDGKPEEYLIMFKNETHNHPTEIEPFGGAATCLGGAIRDPLSGRVYVSSNESNRMWRPKNISKRYITKQTATKKTNK